MTPEKKGTGAAGSPSASTTSSPVSGNTASSSTILLDQKQVIDLLLSTIGITDETARNELLSRCSNLSHNGVSW